MKVYHNRRKPFSNLPFYLECGDYFQIWISRDCHKYKRYSSEYFRESKNVCKYKNVFDDDNELSYAISSVMLNVRPLGPT